MPDNYVKRVKPGNYFKLPNPGLKTYFHNVKVGYPDEIRTPLFEGLSMEEVLKSWERYVQPLKCMWPTLYDYEIDQKGKVGPMSVMKPLAERMPDIDAYYDLISLDRVPLADAAINAVVREWLPMGAIGPRMQDQYTTVDKMKKSTNSGTPYWTRKARVVPKTVPARVFPDGREVVGYQGKGGYSVRQWKYAAVLAWRGQEGGPSKDDTKQRVVWAMPFAVNLRELQVYQPLIEYAQHKRLVPAWVGQDAVEYSITKLFDTKDDKDVVMCTDFSKFDQHFNSVCQKAVEEILIRLFDTRSAGQNFDEWLDCVFPIKYMIPLAIQEDTFIFGRHGMASGSGGTNADETLLHRALQHEAAIKAGARLNPHSMCLGDDGIISYPGLTPEDVMRSYTSHGLEMNPEKQYVSTQDCVYLRRWYHKDYRDERGVCKGVYPTFRALGRLCEQERFYDPEIWSKEMTALRQLSILENINNHPLREQFVNFCMQGDKYRLGIDIPGFLENIASIAQEATQLMPEFLGYTKSLGVDDPAGSIADWWIVQYLVSLKGKDTSNKNSKA